VTISEVSLNIRDKSCQKCVTINVTSDSTLLSFCQIFLTITIAPRFAGDWLAQDVRSVEDGHRQHPLPHLDLDAGLMIPGVSSRTDTVQSSEQVLSFECDVDAEPPLFRGLLSPRLLVGLYILWLYEVSLGRFSEGYRLAEFVESNGSREKLSHLPEA